MFNRKRITLLLVGIITLASCRVGDVTFTGSVQGYPFQPDGTVFGWIDSDNSLTVAMTWVAFDPARDLDDWSANNLKNLKGEFEKRDAMSFKIADYTKIVPLKTNGTPVLSSWIKFAESKSARPLEDSFASVRITKFNSLDAQPTVEGVVEFAYGQGLLRGTFSAPVYKSDAVRKIASDNWTLLGGQ